jgi:hypothetical protein
MSSSSPIQRQRERRRQPERALPHVRIQKSDTRVLRTEPPGKGMRARVSFPAVARPMNQYGSRQVGISNAAKIQG